MRLKITTAVHFQVYFPHACTFVDDDNEIDKESTFIFPEGRAVGKDFIGLHINDNRYRVRKCKVIELCPPASEATESQLQFNDIYPHAFLETKEDVIDFYLK